MLNKLDAKIISFRFHVENPVWFPGGVSFSEVSYGCCKASAVCLA